MSNNIVNNYSTTMVSIFNQVIQGYENAQEVIRSTEAQLNDIAHEIEFSKPKDMYHGYLMYKAIHELRVQRRQAKEEAELLQEMYEFFTGTYAQQFKSKIQQIQGHSVKLRDKQERRTYKPRELADLTIEGVHSEGTKPFEELMSEFKKTKVTMKGGKLRK